ncbi:helix-turn-helix domain-containing protein [Lactococcus protaetiae]|uniref:Helix-turn-helix transcriptional regulator n=1 Tax=Lactococcus protaetiae TaxID=2592653 RepID=A0A514Z9E7_9LACT|nr:helix-turn-helix transcriptional regulator [Lactococcus protaetiae]QDK71167.1 helix-turn-helix transcriptional regulator [Lactococcus protaetiae]
MGNLEKQKEINERIKAIKKVIQRYRIPILRLSEKIDYPGTIVADVLFFRKKAGDDFLEKVEKGLEGIIRENRNLNVMTKQHDREEKTKDSFENLGFLDSKVPVKFGVKIRRIRYTLKYSKEEFGEKLSPSLSVRIIDEMENNQFVPSLSYLIQIADMGNVTLDWLLRD